MTPPPLYHYLFLSLGMQREERAVCTGQSLVVEGSWVSLAATIIPLKILLDEQPPALRGGLHLDSGAMMTFR